MKARDIMERFRQRLSAQNIEMRFELRVLETVFGELADVLDFAQLVDGKWVRTHADFVDICRELQAVAALELKMLPLLPKFCIAGDHTCPDCHHEHEGMQECLFYEGEGRVCHCTSKVSA